MTDEQLIQIRPSPRQLSLQKMEFYAFVHFTVNTFTDREWGDGKEDPSVFNPSAFNPNQWVAALRDAGMTGLILTCKHHDGFCLWPSRYTDHTVAASPWRQGCGDAVREVAEACRRGGLAFGVYLSPWDRHSPFYGTGKPYDDYFVSQLTELLSEYGDIRSVWFDGACGEGPNGKKQFYDWPRYDETIRRLQPGACIHVCGPDIRWCGNEAGNTRPSEWSVVPRRTADTEKVASLSQQQDDTAFRTRVIRAQDLDLGSRAILAGETDCIWYPAEVNTSIRPGWFWHAEENDQVKPLDQLIHIYENAVGGNATFLLNIPPDRRGLFHEADVSRLSQLGSYLRSHFSLNLADRAELSASDPGLPNASLNALRSEDDTYYEVAGSGPLRLTLRWPSPVRVRYVVLKEAIAFSQRVERFRLEAFLSGRRVASCPGTVIGYKKIVRLDDPFCDQIILTVEDYRVKPLLSFFGIYS